MTRGKGGIKPEISGFSLAGSLAALPLMASLTAVRGDGREFAGPGIGHSRCLRSAQSDTASRVQLCADVTIAP